MYRIHVKAICTAAASGLVMCTSLSACAEEATGFARCDEYVNVRTDAGTDAEITGKLYQNNKVTILGTSEDGSWYHIRSGNVDGYVAADYIVTGDEADAIADEAG